VGDTPVKRRKRYEARILGSDGRLFSPIAPEKAHGSTSGPRYWGCQCGPCRIAQLDIGQLAAIRKWKNYQLLSAVNTPVAPPEPAVPVINISAPAELPPEPPRQVAPTPGYLPDGRKVPPITKGAQGYVRDPDHLSRITHAYNQPQIVRPSGQPGRVIHTYEDVEIVVLQDDGTGESLIVSVKDHEPAEGEPEILTSPSPAIPRARGGRQGRRGPTDQKGLLRELERRGVHLRKTGGGHIVAERNGKSYTLSSTPSSGKRSVSNTVASLRRVGILPSE
jgi:hypothetical protein